MSRFFVEDGNVVDVESNSVCLFGDDRVAADACAGFLSGRYKPSGYEWSRRSVRRFVSAQRWVVDCLRGLVVECNKVSVARGLADNLEDRVCDPADVGVWRSL